MYNNRNFLKGRNARSGVDTVFVPDVAFSPTLKNSFIRNFWLCGICNCVLTAYALSAGVVVHPAPVGEELSKDYEVEVDGQKVPVYLARVAPQDQAKRWKAMDDKANSAQYYEMASFASFDMQEPVNVVITCQKPVQSACILPKSAGIVPEVKDGKIVFRLSKPMPVTIEVNGTWVNALHVFANPPEVAAPRKDDPNVIYFGPGIHEVSHLEVKSGMTLYIAGGAVVRGIIKPDEKFHISGYSGLKTYQPLIVLHGSNITVRGRGIIDGTGCTTHAKHMLSVRGADITLEGIILRDSSTWTIPIRKSDRVTVRNLKLIGYRANSDGIDICNSRDVLVEKCFIRTLDDLIVVKSDKDQGRVNRIVVRDCVLWNEVAHAISVGAELREDVDDVLFENCDVIHDLGREWAMRVYHCDAATVSNIRFENIRVEEARDFVSVWIGKAVWTRDAERGHIRSVVFKDITAVGKKPVVELKGFDAGHMVEDVKFQNVVINGKPLLPADVKSNEFVKGVQVIP